MMPMMDSKPLHNPKSKAITGLFIYCYHCKKLVYDFCKETGKPISQCKYGDKHVYKAIAHVAGTDNQRRMKVLDTRDLDTAKIMAIEFQREVKSGSYQSPREKVKKI